MANIIRGLMERLPKGMGSGLGALGVAGGAAYGISESMFTVEGGHRAIIFSRVNGVLDDVLAEGLHFRIPWFQYPIIYDVRTKPHRITSLTGTKDLQMVNVSLRVLSRPQINALPTIYRNLGQDYDDRVLPSIVNEVLKSELARFNAAQLITQRDRVSDMIRQRLTERATEFWLALDDVSITDLGFGNEYTAAVEAKQVAQQDAQRAALEVERARQDCQRTIVNAEGEAQSAALIGEAVKQNPGFLNLRRIEAARSIAGVVANSSNRVYLDSSQLLLNVGEFEYDSNKLKPSDEKNPTSSSW